MLKWNNDDDLMIINKYDDDFVEVVLISLSIRFYLFLELSSSLRNI